MIKNFILCDDSVTIQVGEQFFDVHNCFDLSELIINFPDRQVMLFLTRNIVALENGPTETLMILFSEVDFLCLSSDVATKMVCDIDEIGYKSPNDFDHDWLVSENKRGQSDHLFIRLIGDEYIRIHGKTANIFQDKTVK